MRFLLLKRKENDIWEMSGKTRQRKHAQEQRSLLETVFSIGEVIDIVEEGNRLIQFHYDGIFEEILDQLGEMPLPPYITHKLQDKEPLSDCLCERMTDLLQHRQQGFILPKSSWSR